VNDRVAAPTEAVANLKAGTTFASRRRMLTLLITLLRSEWVTPLDSHPAGRSARRVGDTALLRASGLSRRYLILAVGVLLEQPLDV
jgi:hypothetical protein